MQGNGQNEQTTQASRASARSLCTDLCKAVEAGTSCKSEVEEELRAIEVDLAATICVSAGAVDDEDGCGPQRLFGLITKVFEEDGSGNISGPLCVMIVLLNVEVCGGVGKG